MRLTALRFEFETTKVNCAYLQKLKDYTVCYFLQYFTVS